MHPSNSTWVQQTNEYLKKLNMYLPVCLSFVAPDCLLEYRSKIRCLSTFLSCSNLMLSRWGKPENTWISIYLCLPIEREMLFDYPVLALFFHCFVFYLICFLFLHRFLVHVVSFPLWFSIFIIFSFLPSVLSLFLFHPLGSMLPLCFLAIFSVIHIT